MDDGFEVTFVVSTPRPKAWELLVTAQPASEMLAPPAEGQWWVPAIEGAADPVEVVPDARLHCRKVTDPCRGTEIVITMEDAESGTRITIVQTGFGEGFQAQRSWLEAGWFTIAADFVTFFERGIQLGRHVAMWWDVGCDVFETGEGLVVGNVRDTTFAARAGLQTGDLVVQLAGAPVLSVRDLSILIRGPLHSGVDTSVCYLRGDEMRTASAVF
jgi:hypothetical protein